MPIKGIKEKKPVKSPIKRDWFNPVKNARTRYSFQIGKEGVGIGAVGITNHAINQLVNSLGTNFNTVTLYFDTNPVEVTTVEGEKILLTQLSFTRDSNGQWISNNIIFPKFKYTNIFCFIMSFHCIP